MATRDLQHSTLSVIGGGKMGEAMAAGWVASRRIHSSAITIVEPSDERRDALGRSGLKTVASQGDAAGADIFVVAVKPQVIDTVVSELSPLVGDGLVVSVAAGVTCERLEGLLGGQTRVVRVMPNTPAMVGQGMAVVSGGTYATAEDVEIVTEMFDLLGEALALEERYQNAATAISGSGPAYFAFVIDALADAGTAVGLDRETAQALALQTMAGTAELLKRSGMQPEELISAVSSPGGTTVAALGKLRDAGLREAFDEAVRAAVDRADELGAGK